MYDVKFAPQSTKADWTESWTLGTDLTTATMRLTVEHPTSYDLLVDINYPDDDEWTVPTPASGQVDWTIPAATMANAEPGVSYIVNWTLDDGSTVEHLLRGVLPMFRGGPT